MSAIFLGVSGEMQQVVGIDCLRMNGIHGKHALRQRASLVEHHGGEPRERVHVVTALDEDSLARRPAYAAKETQWH